MKRTRWAEVALVIAAGSAGLGCGSDSAAGGGSDLLAGGRQGIYSLDASTLNESSCASEGADRLDMMQTQYAFLANDARGLPLIWFGFCLDVADCQSDQSSVLAPGGEPGVLGFTKKDSGAYGDDVVSGGFATAGTCTGAFQRIRTLQMSASSFVLEERYSPIDDSSAAADGSCPDAAARAAASSASCQRYAVYRGSFAQAL